MYIFTFYTGDSSSSPILLDLSSTVQPGLVYSDSSMYIEYHSTNNNDGFKGTLRLTTSGESTWYCNDIYCLLDSKKTYTYNIAQKLLA